MSEAKLEVLASRLLQYAAQHCKGALSHLAPCTPPPVMPPQQPPSRRDFIFVSPGNTAQARKRRAAPLACDECRRKKKRCEHASEDDIPNARGDPRYRDNQLGSRQQPDHVGTVDTTTVRDVGGGTLPAAVSPARSSNEGHASSGDEDGRSRSRFIGDLNPEGELLHATCDSASKSKRHDVGVWHTIHPTNASSGELGRLSPPFASVSLCHHFPPLTQQIFAQIMHEQSLHVLPPAVHFSVLETFYFAHIHPILPGIDPAEYEAASLGSATRTLLAQTICLAVHTNPSLRDHLRLPGMHAALLPMEFGQRILSAMRLNMEMALVANKAILVRVLTTMSFFAYGCDSLELSCQFFVRAVHIAYTIGLHLDRDAGTGDISLDGLFCYLWSIDRLHAAIQGRPVIIHDHDLVASAFDRSHRQSPGLRITTHIATLLDKVISLYRPNAKVEALSESEFSTFEDIVICCGAVQVPSSLLATLELFYHAVAILSCRPAASARRVKNPRQMLSALHVVRILDEDTFGAIVLLPYVPYAASLSLSTAYRDLKFGKIPLVRERASNLVTANYKHLCRLKEFFWSAAVMADMARRILEVSQGAGHTRTGPSSREGSARLHSNALGGTATDAVGGNPNILPASRSDTGPDPKSQTILSSHEGRGGLQGGTAFAGIEYPPEGPQGWFQGPNREFDDVDALFEGNLDLGFPSFLYDLEYPSDNAANVI